MLIDFTLLHVNTPVVSAGRSQGVIDGIQVDVLLALALAVGAAGQVSRAQARGGVGNQTGSEGRERAAVRLNDITLFCPVAGSKAARLISAQGITDSYMYWGDCNRFRPLTRSPMEALI